MSSWGSQGISAGISAHGPRLCQVRGRTCACCVNQPRCVLLPDAGQLLIGAPGSPTQLVLTGVYLQPEALPLVDGAILNRLAADTRVAAVAPLALGDVVQGYPVVGTTPNFAGRWGRMTPAEGRLFEREGEALVGADVAFTVGDAVTPAHAMAGERRIGEECEEESRHRHKGVRYTVVARLPPLGTAWDRAILIPIETMWETHGLGNGHASDDAELGLPFDRAPVPGVPAIVVKPRGVAEACALRREYRQGGTMALFPAEVLVSLYRAMGDARDALVTASVFNDVLVFVAVLLLLFALTGLRRRRYAVLRALGAPPAYIFLVVWMQSAVLLGLGCLLGLPLGWGTAWLAGCLFERETGLHLAFAPTWQDGAMAAALCGFGTLLSLLPTALVYRASVAEGLRG